LGFCGQGEAKDYIADGAIEIGGRLPINTHGGQLGEAYIHGMNGIAEGVRQLRGTSVNQVDNVEQVLVTAGGGVPTPGLILGWAGVSATLAVCVDACVHDCHHARAGTGSASLSTGHHSRSSRWWSTPWW
jgi:acetyl-CoA acetyltransferase